MNKKESMYDFRIIFQKLAELNSSKEEFATCDQLIESDEINK